MFFKRFMLFFLVNILVVITISLILNILGVRPYLTHYGLDYQALAIFCLVWGMGGAFISLLLSKFMAKMLMGVTIVDNNSEYSGLVQMVHFYAKRAGLPKMPEVGVYEGAELNAFATGPSRSNSLVAVSTGLLQRMNQSEVEGVIGHEIAHIANGDMVTMTLVQGVINAFVMFLARVATFALEQVMKKDDDEGAGFSFIARYAITMVFELLFGILGVLVTAAFSRRREYKADADSAKYAGRDKMIAALKSLQQNYEQLSTDTSSMSAFKISNKSSWLSLFSTHPDLEDRINALMKGTHTHL